MEKKHKTYSIMKTRTVVETYDGTRFDSQQAAYEYLDNLLYNKAERIARKLPHQTASSEITDFIVANLAAFEELIAIQKDMTTSTKLEDEE